MKSVILSFPNQLVCSWASAIVLRNGYSIEYSFKTAGDVIRVADFCTSPVLLCAYQFTDMNSDTLSGLLAGKLEMVIVALPHQKDLLRDSSFPVVSYPASAHDVLVLLEQAEKRAVDAALGLRPEIVPLRPADRPAEEKLLILKAKNLILEKTGITESQAHRYLQKTSMDRGLKLSEAAVMLIEGRLPFPR